MTDADTRTPTAATGDRRRSRRTRRTAMLVAAPVLVVMLAFVWVLATSEPSTDRRVDSPLLDEVVPSLSGPTLSGGSYDIDRHRGEFVLVNFFATWCTPCVREHPELVAFAREHERRGDASVVSVIYDDRTSDAREFFAREGGDWPVVLDTDARISLDFAVTGVPESFLVAPDGTVVAKIEGGVTAEGLDQLLADMGAPQ